jgi:hypothetical protein
MNIPRERLLAAAALPQNAHARALIARLAVGCAATSTCRTRVAHVPTYHCEKLPMRKVEREKIERALYHLMDNEGADFHTGIGLLCELIGERYPAYHDTSSVSAVSLGELMKSEPRPFAQNTSRECGICLMCFHGDFEKCLNPREE